MNNELLLIYERIEMFFSIIKVINSLFNSLFSNLMVELIMLLCIETNYQINKIQFKCQQHLLFNGEA